MLAMLEEARALVESGDATAVGLVVVCRGGAVLRKCDATPANPLSRTVVELMIKTG